MSREVGEHLVRLQELISSVVVGNVNWKPAGTSGALHRVSVNDGAALEIRGGSRWLSVRIMQALGPERLPGDSGLHVASYRYEVQLRNGSEILAYHLHPGPIDAIPSFPHLHVSAGAGDLIPELQRAHPPTGPVTLADFVLLLIRDFGVRPLRADWASVLEQGGPR